jgi:hypothetical protein
MRIPAATATKDTLPRMGWWLDSRREIIREKKSVLKIVKREKYYSEAGKQLAARVVGGTHDLVPAFPGVRKAA